MEKSKNQECKKRLLLALLSLCIFIGGVGITGCSSNNSYNDTNYGDTQPVGESRAIEIAKESKTVQDKIAAKFGAKFYYTPDWGTCTAKKDSASNWEVSLKGTLSGYEDDYKTKFINKKKFTAVVTVTSSGSVRTINVYAN